MGAADEVKRFEKDLRVNAQLREKLDETIKRIVEAKELKTDGEILAKAAGELGYVFTAADLERSEASSEELDLEEMEMVSGGGDEFQGHCSEDYICKFSWHTASEDEYGHDKLCVTAWHCHTIMMHTETEDKNVNCWSDYVCLLTSHCRTMFD